jgi:hypothetical protein
MDTLRGNYESLSDSGYDAAEDDLGREGPPAAIGTDERRMQVRAYNHWASLLSDRNFPAIEDLDTTDLPDFGPYSVLLDFTAGIENPGITFLGDKLAYECGASSAEMQSLADVPSRSLLSRITDHYMQILANQAPIGFEAEFVNQRGKSILYRGILLPFSNDDDTIDFIYGVINWKELADQQAADELLLEIDQALESKPASAPALELGAPLTDWADGPGAVPANDIDEVEDAAAPLADPLDLGGFANDEYGDEPEDEDEEGDEEAGLPLPSFGLDELELTEVSEEDEEESVYGSLLKTPIHFPEPRADAAAFADDLAEPAPSPGFQKAPIQFGDYDFPAEEELEELAPLELAQLELAELDPSEMELGDWLAAAREMALAARSSEDRTRNALYDAIGRAYDFSLAASQAPGEFEELLTGSGLTVQDRAPMTPVVKLVFGADYDKTRLTEYAAALSLAHRIALPRGALGEYLAQAEGGLKGVVKAERRLRREENGKPVEAADAPRHALARKLRAMPAQDFAAIPADGSEFALVMIRRTDTGVVMLGEVPDDVALIEKAGRRLIG